MKRLFLLPRNESGKKTLFIANSFLKGDYICARLMKFMDQTFLAIVL